MCNFYPHARPCGYASDSTHECTCSPIEIECFRRRTSGALLDQIGIPVSVPRVAYEKLECYSAGGETSAAVGERVERARALQTRRFAGTSLDANAEMSSSDARRLCQDLLDGARTPLRLATNQLGLSACAIRRMLRLSRMLAHLKDGEMISAARVAGAVQYGHHSPA